MPRGVRKQVEPVTYTVAQECIVRITDNGAERVQQALNALYNQGVPDDASVLIEYGRITATWAREVTL